MFSRKITAVFLLLVLFYPGRVIAGPNAETITTDDLFKVAGMLYWNLEIPLDLEEDETLLAMWTFIV